MGIIQVFLAILIGFGVMCLSMFKLWKPSPECQEHRITLPLGIEFQGCSIWGAIFFGGLLLLAVGLGLNSGGADNSIGAADAPSLFLSSAYAINDEQLCTSESGWVYMGTGEYSKKWWFVEERGSVPSDVGVLSNPLIMKSEDKRNLREDHYSTFTGTIMGRLFGVQPPKIICVMKKGQLVDVKEFVSVGRSRIWARVEMM
jgi:hypothetical protein